MIPLNASQMRARKARAALGMTRAEFGARLGQTPRSVYSWEMGTRNPSGAVLKLIQQMLDLAEMERLIKDATR